MLNSVEVIHVVNKVTELRDEKVFADIFHETTHLVEQNDLHKSDIPRQRNPPAGIRDQASHNPSNTQEYFRSKYTMFIDSIL